MIREFGAACSAAGFQVFYKPNPGDARIPYPPGFRKGSALPRGAVFAAELTNTDRALKRRNLEALDRGLPPGALLLTSAVTVSTGEQSAWIRRRGRLVGMSALPTLLAGQLVELSAGIHTERDSVSRARDLFAELGKDVSVVQDRIGMVMPRILCSLINEASFAVMEEVATAEDVDRAMKLGTNYPRGPVEWAGKIGVAQVVSVLRALHDDLGEERYRIAPLLQMMAAPAGEGPT